MATERDEIEARWLAAPPTPTEAFVLGDRLLARWTALAAAAPPTDDRPWYVRRYWHRRDVGAGLA